MEKTTKELLRTQYDRLNEKLEQTEPGTDEFGRLLKQWNEIHEKLMAEDKADMEYLANNKPWFRKIDINTVISAGVTILGTVLVLDFEKIGNVTSKAFSWIPKPRMK